MTRDLRDPETLGMALARGAGAARSAYGESIPLSEIYDVHVGYFAIPDWKDDGFMSSNPADHHSQTPQTLGDMTE